MATFTTSAIAGTRVRSDVKVVDKTTLVKTDESRTADGNVAETVYASTLSDNIQNPTTVKFRRAVDAKGNARKKRHLVAVTIPVKITEDDGTVSYEVLEVGVFFNTQMISRLPASVINDGIDTAVCMAGGEIDGTTHVRGTDVVRDFGMGATENGRNG